MEIYRHATMYRAGTRATAELTAVLNPSIATDSLSG
jgi:hypothetical protein